MSSESVLTFIRKEKKGDLPMSDKLTWGFYAQIFLAVLNFVLAFYSPFIYLKVINAFALGFSTAVLFARYQQVQSAKEFLKIIQSVQQGRVEFAEGMEMRAQGGAH